MSEKPLHKPPRKKTAESNPLKPARPVTLKELAASLNLSPTAVSLVLNGAAGAAAIPPATQDRIFAAARAYNYRPHFIARLLRARRTYTVGVLVPEVSGGYAAMVLGGIEECLLKEHWFHFAASHSHRQELIQKYPQLFIERCVEGLIAVDTPLDGELPFPVVSVSGHKDIRGVTNIVLDHQRAAELALEHLVKLGHRRIAVIKGQQFSSDTDERWRTIRNAARKFGVPIQTGLIAQLTGYDPSPEPGYVAAQKLLARGESFTALFAFNDVSAIGAIRALQEAGRRVPDDISVIGFDDIDSAAFYNPALTTIRQPLRQMGRLAAEHLLQRIGQGANVAVPEIVVVAPELIARQSTAAIQARSI
jgi:LacI family transcriptional regulator